MRCHSRHRTCPENLCINANHRNLAIFGLATSREKRVSKNKDMYGVACKPIHKSRDRRDSGSYPPTQFPIRSGLANFLFFQIFVSLVILTMPTPLWADLISLTVNSTGIPFSEGKWIGYLLFLLLMIVTRKIRISLRWGMPFHG